VERDEDGHYVEGVPELPGCHTQVRSPGKLIAPVHAAIELCLEALNYEGVFLSNLDD
jgi:predicted RNase H-like HicB family nuclease